MESRLKVKSFKMFNDPVYYKTGDVIFNQGEPGNVMYAVLEGEVDIIVNGKTIFTVGQDELLGEMALIEDKPRSATAKAKTDCKLLVIDEQRFNILLQQTPSFVINILKSMADRIRMMNDK